MALLGVGLSDVSTDRAPQMDIGVVTLESIKVEVVPAEGDKAAMINVSYKNVNSDEGDERTIRKMFSLSEKAKRYFKLWLLAAGREDLAEADEIDTDELLGLVAEAVIGSDSSVDKDTGEPVVYSNIKKWVPFKPESDS